MREELVVEKDNLITELPFIGKEYRISFDVFISEYGTGWQSVIHFTVDGDIAKYGDRIPGVFIYQDKKMYIASAINGNRNYVYGHTTVIPKGKWSQVEISQKLINSKA